MSFDNEAGREKPFAAGALCNFHFNPVSVLIWEALSP